jgi:hypothetical protein
MAKFTAIDLSAHFTASGAGGAAAWHPDIVEALKTLPGGTAVLDSWGEGRRRRGGGRSGGVNRQDGNDTSHSRKTRASRRTSKSLQVCEFAGGGAGE